MKFRTMLAIELGIIFLVLGGKLIEVNHHIKRHAQGER